MHIETIRTSEISHIPGEELNISYLFVGNDDIGRLLQLAAPAWSFSHSGWSLGLLPPPQWSVMFIKKELFLTFTQILLPSVPSRLTWLWRTAWHVLQLGLPAWCVNTFHLIGCVRRWDVTVFSAIRQMEVMIVQLWISDTRLTDTGAATIPSDNLDESQFDIECHAFQFLGTLHAMFTRFARIL